MNEKSAAAFLAGLLLVGDFRLEQSDSLAPRQHFDTHYSTDSAAEAQAAISASGGQVAFDNEAWSPAMPWARQWPSDQGLFAAQRMLRYHD